MAVAHALGQVAEVGDILQDPTKTAAHQQDLILKKIPGFGQIRSFQDMLANVKGRIKQRELTFGWETFFRGQRGQLFEATDPRLAAIGSQEALGRAYRGMAVERPAEIDRSTWQGERRFVEQQMLLPAQDAAARARAEVDAARSVEGLSGERLGALQARGQGLHRRMREAEERRTAAVAREGPFRARQQAEIHIAGRDVQSAAGEVMQNELRMQQEIVRLKEAGLTVAQRESALRQASIALGQTELQILQQREQILSSGIQRFGGMSQLNRSIALQAARVIKGGGIANLPPQLLAMAEQAFPQFVGKEREKWFQTTPEFRTAQREGFLPEGNLNELRQQVAAKQFEVRLHVAIDHAALAEKVAQVLGREFGQVIASIKRQQIAERLERRAEQAVRNNTPG
jgi:hypothetical protein